MRNQLMAPTLAVATLAAMLAGTACSRDSGSQLDDGQATDALSDAQVDPAATNVPGENPISINTGTTGSNPLVVATEGGPAPYIANSAGAALYALDGDTDGKCADECARVWPPMLVSNALPSHTPGLEASMVGIIQRADGSTQVAYNGHPLYAYAADGGAARTAGHGVSDKWGNWALVGPQGAPLAK